MSKFQNNNTTDIATFEDFILTAYVIIDDLYHQFVPPEVTNRRHVLDAKLSDPEIISISICGELAGVDSENAWFSFVKKNTTIFSQDFAAAAVLSALMVPIMANVLLKKKPISAIKFMP